MKRIYKDKLLSFNNFLLGLKSKMALKIYIILLTSIALFALYAFSITPKTYDIKIGQISPKTFIANRTIIDKYNTAKEQQEAAKKVEPIYVYSSDINDQVLSNLDSIFNELKLVQEYGNRIREEAPENEKDYFLFEEENIDYAKTLITKLQLNDYQIGTLLNISTEDFKALYDDMKLALNNILKTSIREGKEQESINYLLQVIGYRTDVDLIQNIVSPILEECIQPNLIIDKEATEKLRQEAIMSVENKVYQKGQNIVFEGDIINKYQYDMLSELGIINNQRVSLVNYSLLYLFILILLLVSFAYLKHFDNLNFNVSSHFFIFYLIIIINSSFAVLAKFLNLSISPTMFSTFMIVALLGTKAAMCGGIISILLNTVLYIGEENVIIDANSRFILIGLVACFIAIFMLKNTQKRQQMLITGACVSIFTFLSNLGFMLFYNENYDIYFSYSLYSGLSVIVSVLLYMGISPIIEGIFRLPTENKLLELTNPQHPLMQRLLLEAPGTYHHSIIVANLSETAANVIGENNLLARAGAYFHDVGKLKNPSYFTENQINNKNFHDNLTPFQSAKIVLSHTKDGVEIGKHFNLPNIIKDIMISHHGTSCVMSFYHKAREIDPNAKIEDFRYDGFKPKTKVETIIMIADTIEAAVRSLEDKSKQSIEDLMNKLINVKIEDGQLDESPLSIQDLNKVKQAMLYVLEGAYHQRVAYASISPKDEEKKVAKK